MTLRIKITLFGMLLMVLAGCAASTEPSRFYRLTPMPGSDPKVLSEKAGQGVSVGVGPVEIPDYLDRPQIVTSSNRNKIKIAEFDRWSGSLKDNFGRVLSENLSILLSTDRVFLFPWRGAISVDYHIGVEVIQFDGELDGNASLTVRWAIFGGNDKKMLVMKRSNLTEPTGARGYEALVAAQSRALGRLSRDIAVAIMNILYGIPEQ